MEPIRATTIIAVRRNGQVALAGDGQVTQGQMVMKHSAKKIRRLYDGSILSGFAGATADAFSLFSKFEAKLDAYKGQLTRAVVELAKEWRSDKVLRNLEAMLLVANVDHLFLIGGNGDLVEPEDGIAAIGSGGYFAYAAAKALVRNTDKSAREIVEESMKIASDICVYTNDRITVEAIES